jgi:hypothetical protein
MKNNYEGRILTGIFTGIVIGMAAPVVAIAALGAVGFGAAGVAAGSVAAGIQSGIGSVAAGSLFASMSLHYYYSPNATLRSAFSWKNFVKKNRQKKFREIFFSNFLGYRCSAANLGYACKNLGGLGPRV